MARKIRLSYPQLNIAVVADMLEEDAPTVCDIVWNMLPVEAKIRHGIYSGREVYLYFDKNVVQHPPENLCHLPLPGELLYFVDTSSNVANSKKAISEIVFVYNRGVSLKGPEDVVTHCSLFARIPGDWKFDWTDFRDACRKALLDDPPVLRIERA